MPRPWIFMINPFLVATNSSYRAMKQVGDFTYAAISTAADAATDPIAREFFTSVKTLLEPPTEAYDHDYVTWLSLQGAQKGQTRSLNDLLDDLRGTDIQAWDRAIQNVYLPGTPPYIALLPRHRTPFQSGSQQDRITAVGALSLAIGTDPKLQTLKTTVNDVYDTLVIANNSQKGSKSTKSGGSAELEASRISLAIALYGALGLVMNYYKATPEAIAPFFLIQLLRDKEQTEFTHALNAGEQRLALTHTFEDGEMLTLADTGNTGLRAALVANKTDAMPDDAFTIGAGEQQTPSPGMLGKTGNRFLMIKNMSDTAKGDYKIGLE